MVQPAPHPWRWSRNPLNAKSCIQSLIFTITRNFHNMSFNRHELEKDQQWNGLGPVLRTELKNMQMMMPKEMKVRLVANIATTVLAIMNAVYAAWFMIGFVNFGIRSKLIIIPVLALVAAALDFWMAKIAWSLEKRTKQLGMVLTAIIFVLGVGSTMFMIVLFELDTPLDFVMINQIGWSLGLGASAALAGILLVAGKLVGEMIEKLKILFYLGFVALGVAVVLLIASGIVSQNTKDIGWISAPVLGAFVTFLVSFVMTILGYNAEAKLIKKKFLVYSAPKKKPAKKATPKPQKEAPKEEESEA